VKHFDRTAIVWNEQFGNETANAWSGPGLIPSLVAYRKTRDASGSAKALSLKCPIEAWSRNVPSPQEGAKVLGHWRCASDNVVKRPAWTPGWTTLNHSV
jgi:hypothetical protein